MDRRTIIDVCYRLIRRGEIDQAFRTAAIYGYGIEVYGSCGTHHPEVVEFRIRSGGISSSWVVIKKEPELPALSRGIGLGES